MSVIAAFDSLRSMLLLSVACFSCYFLMRASKFSEDFHCPGFIVRL